MSDRLFVGTRKGLFTLERKGGSWEIDRVDFLGEPVSMFLQDHRDGWLYAFLNLGHFGPKLHRSSDGGANWEECGVPKYPEGAVYGVHPMMVTEGGSPTQPASLKEIWCLEPGGDDQPDLLWAGTIPGGLFQSRDRGTTWELVESLWNVEERLRWFGGGKDDPGIHSICVDPRDTSHVRVGVSCGGVWVTRDGGTTWACKGDGLRADYTPPDQAQDPVTQDPHLMVQCPSRPECLWIQHHNGIFRSTDDCESWQEITDVDPSVFGFAVSVHPDDPDTAWFVPAVKDEIRVPVDGKFLVTRTRDGGKTFEKLSNGFPQEHCYDLVYRHAMDLSDGGKQLVIGSTTGGLWTSDDSGDSWGAISNTLPMIYCLQFER